MSETWKKTGFSGALVLSAFITTTSAQPLDDPMRPTTRQPPPEPTERSPETPAQPQSFRPADFSLTRIYLMGDARRAMINGEWHEPGDRLADAVITDILPDAAVVMHGDLMHMLYRKTSGARFRRTEDRQ